MLAGRIHDLMITTTFILLLATDHFSIAGFTRSLPLVLVSQVCVCHWTSKTWSDTLARVWYCCKCWRVKISVLSRRSSLCRRRQFSTTTTVKAPQSPRAVRSHDYQLLCLSTTTSLVSAMYPIYSSDTKYFMMSSIRAENCKQDLCSRLTDS